MGRATGQTTFQYKQTTFKEAYNASYNPRLGGTVEQQQANRDARVAANPEVVRLKATADAKAAEKTGKASDFTNASATTEGNAAKKQTGQTVDTSLNPLVLKPAKPVNLMKYPSDLPDSFQIIFHFGEYTSEVALRNWYVNHDLSIALPLPGNLVDTTSLGYSSTNLGAIGGELLGLLTNIAKQSDWIQAARDEVNQAVRNPGRLPKDISTVFARRVLSGVSPTLGTAFDLATGSTPNPHIAVSFTNVNLRTFTYTWKMSPNSIEESMALEDIIRTINTRILPRKDGSNFMLSFPNHCQVLMQPATIGNAFKFKPCVVESFNVNYAPNGIPSTFMGTNLPTEIEMSMTLKEVQIRTSEDYQTSQFAQG